MKLKILRWIAIILIIEVGLVHFFTTQHAFEEAWIEGFLFVANFLGALVAAYGIYRQKTWGWVLGFAVAASSLVAYVWSRTSGLPGLPPEEWFDPWGMTAIVTEGLFCILFLVWVLWRKQTEPTQLGGTKNWRYVLPVTGLVVLALINVPVNHYDLLNPELAHAHVFFLWQVRFQPEISSRTLEEQYGMQVARATVSAENSVVDVRMRILDPEKAESLIEEGHFALLVGGKLIQAPHVSRHMLVNKTIIVLFPNQKNLVKSGMPVSLVFENLRVEPVTVE